MEEKERERHIEPGFYLTVSAFFNILPFRRFPAHCVRAWGQTRAETEKIRGKKWIVASRFKPRHKFHPQTDYAYRVIADTIW